MEFLNCFLGLRSGTLAGLGDGLIRSENWKIGRWDWRVGGTWERNLKIDRWEKNWRMGRWERNSKTGRQDLGVGGAREGQVGTTNCN